MLNRLIGPSWKTSLAGWVTLVATAFQQVFVEHGWPKNEAEWTTFIGKLIIAYGFLAAKDGNVSNAPVAMVRPSKVQ